MDLPSALRSPRMRALAAATAIVPVLVAGSACTAEATTTTAASTTNAPSGATPRPGSVATAASTTTVAPSKPAEFTSAAATTFTMDHAKSVTVRAAGRVGRRPSLPPLPSTPLRGPRWGMKDDGVVVSFLRR
jgi:hypothetical protein